MELRATESSWEAVEREGQMWQRWPEAVRLLDVGLGRGEVQAAVCSWGRVEAGGQVRCCLEAGMPPDGKVEEEGCWRLPVDGGS
jgi:hypothetical protein